MKQQQQAKWVLSGLALCAVASLVFACLLGSVAISLPDFFTALGGLFFKHAGQPDTLAATLLHLRLERALSGFATGASLALAGVLMQALLRNPLADPYVLGISGGASVGALLAILLFGLAWVVDLAAFIGALGVAGLLFGLAYRDVRGSVEAGAGGVGNAGGHSSILLLTGVMIASGCGAVVTLLLSIAPDVQLRGMVFWIIGDLSNTPPRVSAWLILIAVGALAMRLARAMNLAAMHADHATTLGVNIGGLRQTLFIAASLLTASAVSSAGSIGFVGLIIPHACRFAWGADHRLLIPAATLAGGAFLVLADTLARSVVAPQQLPVGVITALIGVPVFLLQLHQLRRKA